MRVQGTFELSKKSLLSWDLFHVKEHSSILGGVRRGRKNKIFREKKQREHKEKRVAHSGGLNSFWKRMQLIRS